ncbi:MAG: glycosyltransferase family 4 protein [Betaproteobacteria bacterium]|nr:glycosyltransferase family 4 protein [Betaproteobacteria bacterium]
MSAETKHVVIDARVVVANQSHGIARYTDEFVRNLRNISSPFRFTLFVTRNSPLLNQSWPAHIQFQILKTSWISWLGQFELVWFLRRIKPDLFHSPSFIVPFLSNVPLVTTIHDLNHVVLSENYSIFHRLYYSVLLARKIKRAKAVITVSQFSQQEIINFFHTPREHVRVIHNGISENFQNPPSAVAPEVRQVLKKYELPEKYILSIGNRKPHKNIARLVEAWCKSNVTLPLVLLSDFDPSLLKIADQYHKKHNLHFLRFIPNDVLPVIYAGAELFVYPSIYEGFGFPPLEAAACGVPVVVSNCSSLPEVMRDCALYIDPSNTDEIARTLERAVVRSPEQQQRIQRGCELAKSYSWAKAAEETHSVYMRVLLKEAPTKTPQVSQAQWQQEPGHG